MRKRKRKWGENPLQKVINLCQTPEVDYMMAYGLLPSLSSRIHLKIMWLPLRLLILCMLWSPAGVLLSRQTSAPVQPHSSGTQSAHSFLPDCLQSLMQSSFFLVPVVSIRHAGPNVAMALASWSLCRAQQQHLVPVMIISDRSCPTTHLAWPAWLEKWLWTCVLEEGQTLKLQASHIWLLANIVYSFHY